MPREPEAVGSNDRNAERELLLEEYRAFRTALSEVESAGETRVNLFLAVSTGVVAVVGLGADAPLGEGSAPPMLFLLLVALLLVGIATLARTVHRNQITDRYKERLDRIRDHLAGPGTQVRELVDWGVPSCRKIHWLGFLFPTRGGLVDIQILLNSFIAAALLGAAAMSHGAPLTPTEGLIAGSIAGFLVAWYFQRWRVMARMKKGSGKRTERCETGSAQR